MARFFKAKKVSTAVPFSIAEDLTISRLSDDGRGIAHHQGKTVFVEGALAGERVKVHVTDARARFIEARALSVSNASASRVEPLCGHIKTCGGCSLQHMARETQLDFKEQALLNQLKHWAQLTPEYWLKPLQNKAYDYRQRIRLGVSVTSKGEVILGFRQKKQKHLVNISACPVMLESFNTLVKPLYQWLQSLPNAPVTHIELMGNNSDRGLIVRHTKPISTAHKAQLQSLPEVSSTRCWFQEQKDGLLLDATGQEVDPRLTYCLNDYGLTFAYHPQDFIQSNAGINEQMVNQALALLKPLPHEHFIDLFCGIGNFSLPLSLQAASVNAYEGVPVMVARARANAVSNSCERAHFFHTDLASNDASVYDTAPIDGLLMDPPRSGAQLICENIERLAPQRILYVSCNPATFARDAHILSKKGYRLQSAGLMDMFPQTSHSEVMGLFLK